jgi:hypothetical protein
MQVNTPHDWLKLTITSLAFLSTSLSAASFISSLLVVRFLDEAFSLLPETRWHSPSRLILLSPVIFLAVGAMSFMAGLAILVFAPIATENEYQNRWGQTAHIAVISCSLASVVIMLGSVFWYLNRFLRRQAERMRERKAGEEAIQP